MATSPHLLLPSPGYKTHGMSKSAEYRCWRQMKTRCLNPENHKYPMYGGRGIIICDKWIKSFTAFYEHVGPRPPGTSIERIENDRGYQPGNVRWATAIEQATNTRKARAVLIDGLVFPTMMAAARAKSVSIRTIKNWCDGQTCVIRGRSYVYPPRRNCERIS